MSAAKLVLIVALAAGCGTVVVKVYEAHEQQDAAKRAGDRFFYHIDQTDPGRAAVLK